MVLLLCLGLVTPAFAGDADGLVWLKGNFDSPVSPDRELSYQFPYSDEWFKSAGALYNHRLAQCTLGLAVSSFRSADQELDRKDEYARQYLSQAGFGDLVSQQFDETPTADTIATLIGSKTLEDDEGEFLLVAVAVSGGGYGDEWLSNFSFGDASVHDGFFSAAFTVFERTFDYVDAHADGGRFKIWTGGYSRAAAVSNMAAVLALESEQISKEDLFVYTFATPNNLRADSAEFSGDYDLSGIFNIVGMFDPVPSVPFGEWGYKKLGTTFRLPAQETTTDYAERLKPMKEVYREITGQEYANNLEVNWFIQKLYQLIYDMVSTAGSYQDELEGVIDEAWNSASSVLHLLRTLCGILSDDRDMDDMLLGEAPSANTLLSVFLYDLSMEKLGIHDDKWGGLNIFVQLVHEHCPEVYISWMLSQEDPADLFVVDLDFRRVFIDSSVSWSLWDGDGSPVYSAGVDRLGRTTMITVPADRSYVLKLSGGSQPAERVKVVEYSAGSLHYAYELFEMDSSGGSYELALPDEFWGGGDIGGMTDAGGTEVLPQVEALERGKIHPSAVFELEDSGFWASHFLSIMLVLNILLILAVVLLQVIVIIKVVRRWKKQRFERD